MIFYYEDHIFGKLPYLRKHITRRSPQNKNTSYNNSGYDSKEDRILNMRVNTLLEKYRNDPKTLDEIKNKIASFVINVTIARDLGVKKQEKKLCKELNNYLNTL